MPFSQSLAMVPQEAVACGRLYLIGLSSFFLRGPWTGGISQRARV
jgi:hypothetical protein